MIRMFLLFGLALLSAPAHAELPCVTPADAVLVIDGVQSDAALWRAEPSAWSPSLHSKITCPPGKRVGLWITSAKQALLPPMTITGCEVGIVVEPPSQTIEGFSIIGARIGVCWEGEHGIFLESHIEATEVGVAFSAQALQVNHISIWGAKGTYSEGAAACTCPGAV